MQSCTLCSFFRFFLLISLFLCFATIHAKEEIPVVAVLNFASKGIPQNDVYMLVDLLSLNLLETGSCHIIGRLERNRLLKGFGYSTTGTVNKKDYKEIGGRLFADFIIGGKVERKEKRYEIELYLFSVSLARIIEIKKYTFFTIKEMIDKFRSISRNLLSYITEYEHKVNPGLRVLDSLSPVPIKERILFIMQEGPVNENDASMKEMLKHVLSGLLLSKRFIPYFTEAKYDGDTLSTEKIYNLLKNRNCHYSAYIKKENEAYHFTIIGLDMVHLLDIPLLLPIDPGNISEFILKTIYEKLPPLSQDFLAGEIKKSISIEEKLRSLLFAERLLSYKWSVSIYQKLLKSVLLYFYAPMLSIISLESDIYFYYYGLIGVGLGYGYTYSYPGTINSDLNSFPFINQHEFRFVPFSLRTSGVLSFVFNLTSAVNIQNAYYVDTHIPGEDEPLTYKNEQIIYLCKLGINVGILINTTESFALYWNGIFLHYTLPLGNLDLFTELNYDTKRQPVSFDVAGIGVIWRF